MTDPQPDAPAPAAPLVMPQDEFEALRTVAAAVLTDTERIEAAAAVLERRYPAARPEMLDVTISELHSIARTWRRMAGSPQSPAAPSVEAGPAVDPSRDLTTAEDGSRQRSGPVPALPVAAALDLREPLGRLAYETETAYGREVAAWGSARRPWEDLSDEEREAYLRIGHAVASYALTENAATYDLACPRCAGFLDRANGERERAERAESALARESLFAAGQTDRAEASEAKLASLRTVLLEGGQDAATVRRRALAIIGSEEGADRP